MATTNAEGWKLESFLDALILELDRAQDTLSVKGLTRRLSYTVQDVNIDLQVFPAFERGRLRFEVAKPGDASASRISFQLGSITDHQIRESTRPPASTDDLAIASVDGVDERLKTSLQAVGVSSTSDLEAMRERKVDVARIVRDKTDGAVDLDYNQLAGIINRARHRRQPPAVRGVSLSLAGGGQLALDLQGENLAPRRLAPGYPRARINGQAAEVTHADGPSMRLRFPAAALTRGANPVLLELDPEAQATLELHAAPGEQA
jgi:hypothetical protein